MNGILGAAGLSPLVIQNVIVVGPNCLSNGSLWEVQLMTWKAGFVAFGGHNLTKWIRYRPGGAAAFATPANPNAPVINADPTAAATA
jgi:hypothetical protein